MTLDDILGDTPVVPGEVAPFRPTSIADGHIADKLGIPVKYLRRMRAERVDLYDTNVNGWLQGSGTALPDGRRFFARTFIDPEGGPGVLRALLSDSYKRIDHLDVLTSVLLGIRETGAKAEIVGCDLSETRMAVKVACPELAVAAPDLLANYRSSTKEHGWSLDSARRAAAREGHGFPPGSEPVVFAGFMLTNSETGGGAFTIAPRLLVNVCKNGLVIPVDMMRAVHLGGKLEDGQIRWSDTTQEKNLALIQAKTTDAVKTFLDVEYVRSTIATIEAKAAHPLTDAAKAVEHVSKTLAFSEETRTSILDHFIRGGQMTAGGIMQAVTAHAQDDHLTADQAFDLESAAMKALEVAASL
jgi:hypothetical protein